MWRKKDGGLDDEWPVVVTQEMLVAEMERRLVERAATIEACRQALNNGSLSELAAALRGA